MINDVNLQFASALTVTSTASSSVVDFGSARNIGVGENLYLVVEVSSAMVGAGVSVVAAIDGSSDNGSWTSAVQTIGTFAAASAAGTQLIARLQPDVLNYEYLRVTFTVSGGTLSGGAFNAIIAHDIDDVTSYPAGYTIK